MPDKVFMPYPFAFPDQDICNLVILCQIEVCRTFVHDDQLLDI